MKVEIWKSQDFGHQIAVTSSRQNKASGYLKTKEELSLVQKWSWCTDQEEFPAVFEVLWHLKMKIPNTAKFPLSPDIFKKSLSSHISVVLQIFLWAGYLILRVKKSPRRRHRNEINYLWQHEELYPAWIPLQVYFLRCGHYYLWHCGHLSHVLRVCLMSHKHLWAAPNPAQPLAPPWFVPVSSSSFVLCLKWFSFASISFLPFSSQVKYFQGSLTYLM